MAASHLLAVVHILCQCIYQVHPPLLPHCGRKSVLCICISIVLQIGSSIPFSRFHAAAAAKVASVVSDSLRPRRWQPTRLCRPWDSPGKNTGVGCHFLLQCMKMKRESEVAQSCSTLATPWTIAYQAPPSMGFARQEH